MRGSADHVTCGQAKLLLANLANWILFSICVLVVHSELLDFICLHVGVKYWRWIITGLLGAAWTKGRVIEVRQGLNISASLKIKKIYGTTPVWCRGDSRNVEGALCALLTLPGGPMCFIDTLLTLPGDPSLENTKVTKFPFHVFWSIWNSYPWFWRFYLTSFHNFPVPVFTQFDKQRGVCH